MTLTTWAVLRIGALIGRNQRRSIVAAGGIAVAWAASFALGLSITGAVPIAARSTATYAWDRAHQARAGLKDEAVFAQEVKQDAFANVPGP